MPFKGRGVFGFARNMGEILPTSLPELPVQLRDLRINQNSLDIYFYFLYKKHKHYVLFPLQAFKGTRKIGLLHCLKKMLIRAAGYIAKSQNLPPSPGPPNLRV